MRTAWVYVDFGTERDPQGARLMEHPTDKELERTRDATLIDCSLAVEATANGIVVAYAGADGHWHFLRHLNKQERRDVL